MSIDRAQWTIAATTGTSGAATSPSMTGNIDGFVLTMAAGSTCPSTSKLSLVSAVDGHVILSSGQILSALSYEFYPHTQLTATTGNLLTDGTTGNAAVADPNGPAMYHEGIVASLIHGSTLEPELTITALIHGSVTRS